VRDGAILLDLLVGTFLEEEEEEDDDDEVEEEASGKRSTL